MKEVATTSTEASSSGKVLQGPPSSRIWYKIYNNVGVLTVAAMAAMVIMSLTENLEINTSFLEDLKRMILPSVSYEAFQQRTPQHWNYKTHSFHPNVSDWNEQRATWIEEHASVKPLEGARPRVLMVTGSSPDPCDISISSHLLLRAGKNKLDYCRVHDMDLYYSMGNPDPDFSDWWVKLPVTRMLMLQHPEVEWVWWLDEDAILTNMSFEIPFAELEHQNLVLYGEDRLVYDLWDRRGLSTGAFLIRNCQWSLDLLDAWGSMGTASSREESGQFQSEVLAANRSEDIPGDDQSGLVVLLAQDKQNPMFDQEWVPMVKLVKESEYSMNANWTIVGPKLEELSVDENSAVPLVTHFEGCLPSCNGTSEFSSQHLEACVEQLERAFDFADNQVYQQFGRQPHVLGSSSELYTLKDAPSDAFENGEGSAAQKEFQILPKMTHWDEWRQAFMENNTWIKREEVLLVSGSMSKPCTEKEGSRFLLRGFKNKLDYSRERGVKNFYNMAVIDKDLTGGWSKLPLLKMLMLNNPAVEWFWWIDSDAAFTNMDFRIPFERYNAGYNASGYNLVMWGVEHEVFDLKKYNGLNTGSFLIRNCQWSLALLDRWASFGASATEELKVKSEDLLNTFLDRPSGWAADTQSSLVYVLVKEREKWASKVYFESVIVMSGEWTHWTSLFVDEFKLVSEARPLVTHFTGCDFCEEAVGDKSCLMSMDRAYNFADNQVLEKYGLRHEHLNSSHVTSNSVGDFQEWTEADIERLINESMEVLTATKEKVGNDEKADESEEESIPNEEDVAAPKAELDRNSQEPNVSKEHSLRGKDPEELKALATEELDKANRSKEEELRKTQQESNKGNSSAHELEAISTEQLQKTKGESSAAKKLDRSKEEVSSKKRKKKQSETP